MVLILNQSVLSGQHGLSCAFAILSDLSIDARPDAAMFLKLRWFEAAFQFVGPLLDRTDRMSDGKFCSRSKASDFAFSLWDFSSFKVAAGAIIRNCIRVIQLW